MLLLLDVAAAVCGGDETGVEVPPIENTEQVAAEQIRRMYIFWICRNCNGIKKIEPVLLSDCLVLFIFGEQHNCVYESESQPFDMLHRSIEPFHQKRTKNKQQQEMREKNEKTKKKLSSPACISNTTSLLHCVHSSYSDV